MTINLIAYTLFKLAIKFNLFAQIHLFWYQSEFSSTETALIALFRLLDFNKTAFWTINLSAFLSLDLTSSDVTTREV